MINFEINSLFKSNTYLVFINRIDDNGKQICLLNANDYACERLGFTIDELRDISPYEIGIPVNISNKSNIAERILAGETVSHDMLFFTKSTQIILTYIYLVKYCYNGETAILAVAKEIKNIDYIKNNIVITKNDELNSTMLQIKKTQEQLIQHEKLASIGQLAAGVAHEINNPLGYILSNIETAQTYIAAYKEIMDAYENLINKSKLSNEISSIEIDKLNDLKIKYNLNFIYYDIEDVFVDVRDGLTKISDTVKSLQIFSRVDKRMEFKEYDLNNGIKDTLLVAKNEIKYIAKVVESLGNIPVINAAETMINNVLLNIILNSCYAIKTKKTEEKGIIYISTYAENNYVVCKIEDNGIGIEQENMNNIFNPFFTTKPIGQGTGLGLSISYDTIVNKHGGEIFAHGFPGKGACFTIKLPITKQLYN